MLVRLLLITLALAALSLLARRLMRPKGLFEIRVTRDGVRLYGAVPGVDAASVRAFIDGLRLPPGTRVRAEPTLGDDGFRLRFNAGLDERTRNEVRGFLTRDA